MWRRVLHEVPWVAGLAVATWMLVQKGAFRLDGIPEGQAWRDYLYWMGDLDGGREA